MSLVESSRPPGVLIRKTTKGAFAIVASRITRFTKSAVTALMSVSRSATRAGGEGLAAAAPAASSRPNAAERSLGNILGL